jgi:hypothetical protein
MMVIGAPARRLAKIADANFAIRFAICTSDYTTQHYVSQTSAKTWSQWAAIQERIGLNSGWLPGEQRTALAAPLGLTVRSHLPDNSAALTTNAVVLPPEMDRRDDGRWTGADLQGAPSGPAATGW